MYVYLIFGVLILVYVIRSYRNYLRRSAVIYIKTKGDINLNSLLTLPPTDSVYKILYNCDSHMGVGGNEFYRNMWDHIVFAHCFPNNDTQNKYVEDLKSLEFVENVDVVTLVPQYIPRYMVFNLFIWLWSVIGGSIGKLPSQPLEKSDTPAFKCSPEMESDMEPVVIFNFLNITDSIKEREYAKVMFTVLFPLVNARFYYEGKPESDRWNYFNIVTYETHSSLCELFQSRIFAKNVMLKREGNTNTYTHVAQRLILPKKKLD